MRFITLILLSTLIVCKVSAQNENRNNLIRINPFGAFASAIPVSYERMFFDRSFSVVAGGAIISNKSGSGQSTYNNSGFIITPEIRYYIYSSQKSPAKIYSGLFFNYEEHTNTTLDRYETAIDGHAFGRGGGLIFGNQWFFENGFVVDFYVGPGYMSFQRTEEYDVNVGKGGFFTSITGLKNSGTKVRFGFSLGISF